MKKTPRPTDPNRPDIDNEALGLIDFYAGEVDQSYNWKTPKVIAYFERRDIPEKYWNEILNMALSMSLMP